MKKALPILTVLGVISSLTSAFYLGQINEFSFNQVTVQFCPKTANINQPNAKESQGRLDLKYCRYRRRLLKEVWESEQYRAAIPLSVGGASRREESFIVQEYRGDNSGGIWLLLAPFLAGSAYLAWSNKCQIDYDKKFKQLEDLKTYYKLATISARTREILKPLSISSKLQGFSKLIDSSPRVDCIAKAGEDGEATSSGKAWLKMKGLGDKNPVEVDLYNYPKSKNFGSESVASSPVQTKQQSTVSNGDWHEEIKKWVSEVGRPSSVDVKAKWEELTGHTLNNEGLRELIKYLNL